MNGKGDGIIREGKGISSVPGFYLLAIWSKLLEAM